MLKLVEVDAEVRLVQVVCLLGLLVLRRVLLVRDRGHDWFVLGQLEFALLRHSVFLNPVLVAHICSFGK